ncbi:peptide chain release factor subunit 3 [Nematocida sp. AWRm77]|nr:peptide chain release factor subunit 3 [Nematocida sp. AWRm77]
MDALETGIEKLSVKKRMISLVFIGHVDAGKSTTGGQILYLSGKIDKRTLDKYEKESREKNRESWYLSWALDSNPEEREKGKTVELGQAIFELPTCTVQVLDAPGHKMYVPSMILGVNQADIAVLLISARTNEFEAGFEKGGQTREHIYLAKASGLKSICVLVNKMDDSTVCWSEDRFNQIVSTTRKLLTALFGKENVEYIPISGYLGDNLKTKVDPEQCPWYKGKTFFEYLETHAVPRDTQSPLFANVTDISKEMGAVHILARIERGVLEKTRVKLYPGSKKLTVVSIMKDEEEIEKAEAGETVRIKFKETEEFQAGDFITALEYSTPKDSNYFLAQVSVLDAKSLISKGYTAMMHMGARTVPVVLGELYKKEKDKIHKMKFAKTSDRFVCEVFTNEVIPLEVYSLEGRAGIFTLRDETRTVGFGKVQKIKDKK